MNSRLCFVLIAIVLAAPTFSNEQPVQVFVLAGQSNMVGQGIVSPNPDQLRRNGGKGTLLHVVENEPTRARFKHLLSPEGKWRTREDVWLANLNGVGKLSVTSPMIGPELQFGHRVGDAIDAPVLLIKVAWGGKSLQVDFRPPSSGGAVGPYYTRMVNRVREVMGNVEKYIPSYQGQGVELAGVAWHQGWNDRAYPAAIAEYKRNCVNLINDLRAEFKQPDLPFIIATTGMSGWQESHPNALSLMNAQLAVPNDPRLLEPAHVFTVDTRGYHRDVASSPSSDVSHWNKNAESYLLIGDGLALAMLDNVCSRKRKHGLGCAKTF